MYLETGGPGRGELGRRWQGRSQQIQQEPSPSYFLMFFTKIRKAGKPSLNHGAKGLKEKLQTLKRTAECPPFTVSRRIKEEKE